MKMNDIEKAYFSEEVIYLKREMLKTRRRDIALKYACTQFSKTNLSVRGDKIVDLAKQFLEFMETGK